MKKFMATALCLMLILSAVVAPVAVSATTADESVFNPVETMWYSVDYVRTDSSNAIDDAYVYSWSPAADGVMTLSVDMDCTDVRVVVENTSKSSDSGVTFNYYPAGGYSSTDAVTYNVLGGDTYKISVLTCSEKSGTASFFVYYDVQSQDGLSGAGTLDAPYVVDENVTSLPTIPAGKTIYYTMKVDETLKYDLTVKGASAKDSFELYAENNGATANAEGGLAAINAITPFMASESIIFAITNTGKMVGGPYTYTMVPNTTASTLGTYEDPAELVMNAYTTANITNACYYYTYTATEDGIISVEIKNTESWVCSVYGGTSEASYCKSTDEPLVNPVEYSVVAGDEITMWVATGSFTAGTVSFEATLKTESEDDTTPTEDSTGDTSENSTEFSTTVAPKFELGDVNLDGTVNIKDATAIQKHIAGLIAFDDSELALADFDKNGSINVKDATAIQKMLAGLAW